MFTGLFHHQIADLLEENNDSRGTGVVMTVVVEKADDVKHRFEQILPLDEIRRFHRFEMTGQWTEMGVNVLCLFQGLTNIVMDLNKRWIVRTVALRK